MGWRSREPPEPADVPEGIKPQANAGSPYLSRGLTSLDRVNNHSKYA